jgi:hypothetical protein
MTLQLAIWEIYARIELEVLNAYPAVQMYVFMETVQLTLTHPVYCVAVILNGQERDVMNLTIVHPIDAQMDTDVPMKMMVSDATIHVYRPHAATTVHAKPSTELITVLA